ncbi:TonB-dependent receptor domain-containing protein [Woeseia oceani]|uniref:TonB-dependent receptor domain-containing protein n=1 Tax=Woeseia oceani TaxID=1548547 RepID=UPI000B17CE11|nr:TonB-dependent receptor [Woeseia oceani]
MNTLHLAAAAACVFLPALTAAQSTSNNDAAAPEEIVVLGRSVTTTATRVEVDREMLVDTARVLKDIPGANLNSNGLITGIAQYRGMYGDRIAVDIDETGIVSGGPNAMDTPLSYLSPMLTEELVVDRGIASVSRAPESIGGYIGTRLARGDFGGDEFGITGTLGTRYSSNGDVSTSVGRLTFANASHRVSMLAELDNGSSIDTPEGEIRPSELHRERYDLSYGYSSSASEVLLYAGRLDTEDAGTPALPMDIRYIKTDLVGLQWSRSLTETLSMEARYAYNDVEHLMDNFGLRQAPPAMQQRQNLAEGKGTQFGIALLYDLDLFDLRVGLDGVLAEHGATITNPNMAMFRVSNFNDVERDVLGAYLEVNAQRDNSQLELGLSYKSISTNAGTVDAMGMPEPMLTNLMTLADRFNTSDRSQDYGRMDAVFKYRYRRSERTEWTFELGSKTRAPSYQELYLWLPLEATGGLADGRNYIGDMNLVPERANEVVVGFSHDAGRFSVSPQLFYRDVNNYIQGVPSTNMLANMVSTMMSGSAPLMYANVEAKLWGGDMAWQYSLAERWSLDGIVSYVRGERTDLDDNLYRLAPLNGSIGLSYAADAWRIKPEVVIYAKQDRVSQYNSEQATAGYEVVNLAFFWEPSEALRFEARLDNLFDETYQDHLVGINRAGGSDIPFGQRLYGAERTMSIGVIASF